MDVIILAPSIISKAMAIHKLLTSAKNNKQSFEQLACHIKTMVEILVALKKLGVDERWLQSGLTELQKVLSTVEELVKTHVNIDSVKRVLSADFYTMQFKTINQQLTGAVRQLFKDLQKHTRSRL